MKQGQSITNACETDCTDAAIASGPSQGLRGFKEGIKVVGKQPIKGGVQP